MNTELKDLKTVQKSKLSPQIKAGAIATVMALHTLRRIAAERGVSIEKLTADDVIHDLAGLDVAIERNEKLVAEIRRISGGA
jgi:hypothetical protein